MAKSIGYIVVLLVLITNSIVQGQDWIADVMPEEDEVRVLLGTESSRTYDSLFSFVDDLRNQFDHTTAPDLVAYCDKNRNCNAGSFVSFSWLFISYCEQTAVTWTLGIVMKEMANSGDNARWCGIVSIMSYREVKSTLNYMRTELGAMEGQACVDVAREWLDRCREAQASFEKVFNSD